MTPFSLRDVRVEAVDPFDVVPYDCRAVTLTHPARLATAALLEGRACAPPSSCRMLELGCADATNLLPLAVAYPNSHFVGVDRSRGQLDAARRDIATLGLHNLELVHADLGALDGGLGSFDYIVAHGVYSWVSDAARERILDLYASGLSEHGVGYLSYNTQPGWGLRGVIRELLLAHTRGVADPREKIARARAHLERLVALGAGSEKDPYAAFLAEILGPLVTRSDSYLMHEYLTEYNRAFSFAEITEALDARGLVILDDLVRATASPGAQAKLEGALRREGLPPGEVEAAIDLLTFRQLRASLIAKRATTPEHLTTARDVFTACEIAYAAAPVGLGSSPELGARADEAPGPVREQILEAALAILAAAWPASLGFAELLARFSFTVAETDRAAVRRDLLRLCGLGRLELRAHPPRFAEEPGVHPRVSALTRLDAARGRRVTNPLHVSIALGADEAAIAPLLDGTRDVRGIVDELRRSQTWPDDGLEARVRESLRVLASHGLCNPSTLLPRPRGSDAPPRQVGGRASATVGSPRTTRRW